jgi:hemerythrin
MMSTVLAERVDDSKQRESFDNRTLMEMVNDVVDVLKSKTEWSLRKMSLRRVFVRLNIYIAAHFARKEKVALKARIPFDEHKRAHQYMQRELQHFIEELESLEGCWSEEAVEHYADYLWNWLLEYVSIDDVV